MTAQPQQMTDARVPLSRERVLHAAIDLADREGIGALTMRRLAHELGVEAMTLYYYVANKNDILAGMVDLVTGEIELPPASDDWKGAIRRVAITEYEILTRHPWAASLTLSIKRVSAPRIHYMNWILGTLREAGFTADQTDHAYHALESHIMGFTLWEVGMDIGSREDLVALATAFLKEFPTDQYPYLTEHIQQHLKERLPDDEGAYAFGLDLILDGLERLRPPA
jgi:AcrR family transcriptional regulator